MSWLEQLGREDRDAALKFLQSMTYYSEAETVSMLVQLNERLTERLAGDGIGPEKMVYVQIHDAGSSSPAILNSLRDEARLERKGCKFLDGRDTLRLHETTNELGQGAIVYVDDFVASGNQFCRARDFAAEFIVGNFAEFLLVPCICEEAMYELGKRGIEARTAHIHSKQERPLHPDCAVQHGNMRARLTRVCDEIDKKGGLGYRGLATMVVFHRNAPNTVPLIVRGSLRQDPWRGVLPRTTDLP